MRTNNAEAAFKNNPKKNAEAGIIRGQEFGKSFLQKVNDQKKRAAQTVADNVGYAVMINSRENDFKACGMNGGCQDLCEKISKQDATLLQKEVLGDADDYAPYVMAVALEKIEQGKWKWASQSLN